MRAKLSRKSIESLLPLIVPVLAGFADGSDFLFTNPSASNANTPLAFQNRNESKGMNSIGEIFIFCFSDFHDATH